MRIDTIKRLASFALSMMLVAVFSMSAMAQYTWQGPELINNGEFVEETSGADSIAGEWRIEGGANGTVSIIDGELAFTDIAEVANQYDLQVNQSLSAEDIAELAKGGQIEVTFDARAEDTKTFHVFLGEVGGSWARYWQSPGDGDVTVGTEMQTYTLSIDVEETWPDMRLGFEVAADTFDLFIDNVSLRRTSETLIRNGDFSLGDSLWITEQLEGGVATFDYSNGELAITDLTTSGTAFHVQAFQVFEDAVDSVALDSIYTGPYEILFEARTDADTKDFNLYFGDNTPGGTWTNFAGNVTVDNEMKQYSVPVNVAETWAQMKLGFEVATDDSPIYFDNVILRRVREIATAPPSFALTTTDGIVTINVTPVEGAESYDIYFSNAPFDTLDEAGVRLIGTVVDSTGLTLEHTTPAPHPSLATDFTAHYAVVAKTPAGTESLPTFEQIETGMSVAENYVAELSTDAVDAVFEAVLDTEVIPEASALAAFFPDGYAPFEINQDNQVVISGGGDGDADLSSKHWIGFDPLDQLLVIYAEVTDDSLVWAGEATGSGGAWDFDSWEMGIGNYSPESFINGSDHTGPEAGDEPDWQLRGGALTTDTGIRGFIHGYGYEPGRLDGEIPNSKTIVEVTADGYRTLTLIGMANLASETTSDAPWVFPSGSEVKTYPMNIALNDNDAGARDTQVGWSDRTLNGDWWQRPQQWGVVAFVGADAFPVSNEDESLGTVATYSLDQNYPNPFNPTTNIQFQLPAASNVTLEVYNLLGQKVATLINNDRMTAGSHTFNFDASNLASGMYIYRMSTPGFVQSKTMVLIK